ncbi:MAG: sugar phosphate isomerase/epimerase [Lachnospiraceae bacterium]|nr:sugar phosphate isomerase/epimerase [Lachnospiraceae bacterium]
MNINKLLIIPQKDCIDEYISLAKEYGCGFEYNDFFVPKLLYNADELEERIYFYKMKKDIPEYCTVHGSFLDVTIFSDDRRIREVSDFRVEESLGVAKQLGAKGVVFHTNFIPNFKTQSYRDGWVESNVVYWKEKTSKYPDINIYIENMFDAEWELLARLGHAMKDVNNFGICFDYAHAHVFGNEEEIENWVVALGVYVKHIHINDNDFENDLHQALGQGKIDWNRFKMYYEKYMSEASVLVEVTGLERTKLSLEYLRCL